MDSTEDFDRRWAKEEKLNQTRYLRGQIDSVFGKHAYVYLKRNKVNTVLIGS